jgi:SAM-dependent methyltransferase
LTVLIDTAPHEIQIAAREKSRYQFFPQECKAENSRVPGERKIFVSEEEQVIAESERIDSQWGKKVVPFSRRSVEYKLRLLREAKSIRDLYKSEFGIDLFVCYGVLLGFTRSNNFIGHDFDFDFAYISAHENKADVAAESARVIERLIDLGFQIKETSFGQYKVWKEGPRAAFRVEIFVGWREASGALLYFAIDEPVPLDVFLPLCRREFLGVALPIPSQPEAVCAAIYGKNWRTPDPTFRYELKANKWKKFSFLFSSQNREHWESYYRRGQKGQPWSILPTQFAGFVANEVRPGRLLEVGCGNGRDAFFFASAGFEVTASDYSKVALELCEMRSQQSRHRLELVPLNLYDLTQVIRFVDSAAGFDIVYARFFLHAVSEIAERNFWRLCAGVLNPGGKCFVEFRTDKDRRATIGLKISNNEVIDGHYRRFLSMRKVKAAAESFSLRTTLAISGTGMAIFRGEDPHVGRFILEKLGNGQMAPQRDPSLKRLSRRMTRYAFNGAEKWSQGDLR